MKWKKNRRRWLNPVSSSDTGAIQTSVEVDEWIDGQIYIDGSIDIWDCRRKIGLNFYANNRKDFKTRMKKIRDLIETLEQFEADMQEAWEQGEGIINENSKS